MPEVAAAQVAASAVPKAEEKSKAGVTVKQKAPAATKPATAKPAAAKPAAAKPIAVKSPAVKAAAVKETVETAIKPADTAATTPIASRLTPAQAAEATKQKPGKVVRDSFSMPKSEHAELKSVRTALARAGRLTTKSEVLRAAVRLLGERSVKELVAVLDTLPVVAKGKGKK
ncbi:MAG: hypothetical protein Q7J47_09075 [Azoarcus sp.]|nr:hypothetical protein [Azoarcus sp.]